MNRPRIHITGAAGSGVSTLGTLLASRLAVQHIDTDAYYWRPTDPPFTSKRPVRERRRLIRLAQAGGAWVLSGSMMGWGDVLLREADLIVFLTAPWPVRRARLMARERALFGDRIADGGDMQLIHREFMHWASQYDQPFFLGRSRQAHEAWLEEQETPVLRLDGAAACPALQVAVLEQLELQGAAQSLPAGDRIGPQVPAA